MNAPSLKKKGEPISAADLDALLSIIKHGSAVQISREKLQQSELLAIVREGSEAASVGAIKPRRPDYAAGIGAKSGHRFDVNMHELGYVASAEAYKGLGHAGRIVGALISEFSGNQLFATSDSPAMKKILGAHGFEVAGNEWQGGRGKLSLWLWKRKK